MPPNTIDRHQPGIHESSKVKSPCHIPKVASQLTDEMSHSTRRAVHQPLPSTRPNWRDCGLQVRMIIAYKCILNLARLRPPRLHNQVLKLHISKLARSRPPSASPNSLDHSLQVYLQTYSITATEFARSWPPSATTNSLNHDLGAHL